jgi:EAL domain-containing protein (putative c-di-GMP-specific phosphodiesterase class I)
VGDPQTQAVLVAIIAFARRANAFVIAEGIESEEILDFVEHAHDLDVMREPAIDGGQGFLLGQPLRFAIRSNCLPSAFSTSTDIVIR